MPSNPRVAFLIVSWNTRQLLSECIDSITATCPDFDYEIIVVDNGSTDGSIAMLEQQYPHVRRIINQVNVGFGQANNQAAAASAADYYFLLNSDARLFPLALRHMVTLMEMNPRAGAVGARLENPDGSFQASYTSFPNLWREFLLLSTLGRKVIGPWYPSHGPSEDSVHRADYVEGAAMLIRGEAYRQVGGFSPEFFMYSEEVFLCFSLAQAGWQVWYQPQARVLHHGGASSKNRKTSREGDLYQGRVRFFLKAYGPFQARLLAYMIYCFTVGKVIIHGFLRAVSGGKLGRPVVQLSDVRTKINTVL
jgi:GT2 family glycosyltransferase